MMNVCMFCSAADLEAKYTEPATKLAGLLAQHGHDLVWGGSNVGLMREIATAVQAGGGKLIGISMENLKATARPNADEMIIARDLAERKALMLDRADAIVTLVGGTGTLDELAETFEMRRHGFHDKPIIVLDTDGFYAGLRQQYARMQQDGFLDRLPRPIDQLIAFAATPEAALELLAQPALETLADAPLSPEAAAI
jgi:hypothetical protein